jgi:methylthioxylose transferase
VGRSHRAEPGDRPDRGVGVNERGLPIVLPSPPLVARWDPHLGWGTPLAIGCLLVGLRLQRLAAGLPWRRLLLAGWLLSLAWMCSLTLVDGLRQGWIEVLLNPNEYLHDLPRIADPVTFLATFTDFIAFTDPVAGVPEVWTTHVAAHPPLATLIFWWLDQIGLGGGFWAGALCILVSSLVAVGLPVTLRELGAEAAARRIVPFVALFPGAVWMAVSADGLFAGVALTGLALVCIGTARRRLPSSLAGGVLLGTAVFLSYGLVLFGLVVLLILGLTLRRYGLRPSIGPWLVAVAGLVAVVAIHLAFGFNWLTGLSELRIRYHQGIASQRPFSYFVYANLAAWLVSCSPLLAVGIARSVAVIGRGRLGAWSQDRVAALLALSGVLAALVADLSALSKAETERIWLTFGVVASAGLALLRGRAASLALMGCAGWALVVNHLLRTGW